MTQNFKNVFERVCQNANFRIFSGFSILIINKLQGYIEFAGKKYTLSPGVSVDRDVLIPICEKSEGNCCKKSWLDSSIRYL